MLSKHPISAKKVTRSSGNVWLIGPTSEELVHYQLPTLRQVLSHLFYLATLKADGVTTSRDMVKSVVKKLEETWDRARIPRIKTVSIIERLEAIRKKYKDLQKNASTGGHWYPQPEKPSPKQVQRENMFIEKLDKLFDIAQPNVTDIIEIEDDIKFILDQRAERKEFIGSVDFKSAYSKKRQAERESEREQRRQTKQNTSEKMRSMHDSKLSRSASKSEVDESLGLSDEGLSNSDSELDVNQNQKSSSRPAKKRGRISVTSPELVASLDRTGFTDRKVTFVLAAYTKALKEAKVLSVDPADIVLNRSSIRDARIDTREQEEAKLMQALQEAEGPFVLHWDGKLLEDIEGPKAEKVDRIAIVITGPNGFQRVLHIPKLKSGTGKAIAEAVFEVTEKYGTTHKIGGLSFDTTLSNTGKFKGAATLFEKLIGRRLVWLACRHHMFEIVVGGVFEHFFGHSKAFTIKIFDKFSGLWKELCKTRFSAGTEDEKVYFILEENIEETLNFAKHYLTLEQPRDDHREVLELLILFLGGL